MTFVLGLHRGGPFCHAVMGVTCCAEGHSTSQLTYDLLMSIKSVSYTAHEHHLPTRQDQH
jgi:hypothetical protein